ncbi:MAG: inositol monophosphatase family protein [Christensenellales bacterium]|jgi:myo-inositol-1(or 4)-monophosphatase
MKLVLDSIVRGAGRMMLEHENAATHKKGAHYNFVTDADILVQEYLREKLTQVLPDSRFFSEEQKNDPLTDNPTWIVDPIDGTSNFMRGRRYSCVSIALCKQKKPVLGIVYNPYANEMFRAEINRGATLNGHPIQVSQTTFEQALVYFGTSPYDPELSELSFKAAKAFLQKAGDLRRLGSAALELCEVAQGKADIFFELRLRPWDYAAGSLIVKEAGGFVCSPLEKEMDYGKTIGIMAANPLCFKDAKNIIQEAAFAN